MPDYGVPTHYVAGHTLTFPDLSVEFLGERHTPSPVFTPGFRRWEFRLTGGGEGAALTWSNGTGLIAPLEFEFRQQGYSLELIFSVEHGSLPEDHLVLWQAAPFEGRLHARGLR